MFVYVFVSMVELKFQIWMNVNITCILISISISGLMSFKNRKTCSLACSSGMFLNQRIVAPKDESFQFSDVQHWNVRGPGSISKSIYLFWYILQKNCPKDCSYLCPWCSYFNKDILWRELPLADLKASCMLLLSSSGDLAMCVFWSWAADALCEKWHLKLQEGFLLCGEEDWSDAIILPEHISSQVCPQNISFPERKKKSSQFLEKGWDKRTGLFISSYFFLERVANQGFLVTYIFLNEGSWTCIIFPSEEITASTHSFTNSPQI